MICGVEYLDIHKTVHYVALLMSTYERSRKYISVIYVDNLNKPTAMLFCEK